MTDDFTRKAIVTFNGSYADGLTKALQAVVEMALEEAADAVGEVGDHAELGAYINAIRALKEK